MGRVWRISLC